MSFLFSILLILSYAFVQILKLLLLLVRAKSIFFEEMKKPHTFYLQCDNWSVLILLRILGKHNK